MKRGRPSTRRRRENWMISLSTLLSMRLPFLLRTLPGWRNSNSGLRASPNMRTGDWRSHPTPRHIVGHHAQSAGTDQAGCGFRRPRRQQGNWGRSGRRFPRSKKPLTAILRKRRQSAAEALKLAPTSQSVEVEAALAFAIAGDAARAESLAQDLRQTLPARYSDAFALAAGDSGTTGAEQ